MTKYFLQLQRNSEIWGKQNIFEFNFIHIKISFKFDFNFRALLPQQQSILIPYLETLASVEETVVREMAVKSLNLICPSLSDYEVQNNYIPMVKFKKIKFKN